jgi:hypothetical protein
MTPTGSKISGKVKDVLLIDRISHSISIVELEKTKKNDTGNIRIE